MGGLHKFIDMVDVVNKRCAFPGCKTQPAFNWEEENVGRFCGSHKSNDMVNVRNKRCAYPGCKKHPSFNFEGEQPRWCLKHKSNDMVNVVNLRQKKSKKRKK